MSMSTKHNQPSVFDKYRNSLRNRISDNAMTAETFKPVTVFARLVDGFKPELTSREKVIVEFANIEQVNKVIGEPISNEEFMTFLNLKYSSQNNVIEYIIR